jgi:hydrogenase maturation protease
VTTLVLGLGNPLLGDEGVGLRALQALSSAADFPPSIELLDGGTAGLSLVPRLRSADRVLVLDAVSAGKPPGTVVRLDGAELGREGFGKISPHQLGLSDILSASRLSGGPEEIVILGVEPASLSLGVGLSPPVERAIGTLVAAALRQLRAWETPISAVGPHPHGSRSATRYARAALGLRTLKCTSSR